MFYYKQLTRKYKIALILILTLACIVLISVVLLAISNNKVIETRSVRSYDETITPTKPQTTQKALAIEKPTATPKFTDYNLEISGWIPTWASDSGFASLQSSSSFTGVSPVWYEVSADGTLVTKYPSNKNAIIAYSAQKNLELLPTVGMFNHDLFHSVLENKTSRDNHVDSIVSTVLSNNYDGIDLDYESISLQDKANYYVFLEQLGTELRANDKKLSVTVLAKWGDDVRYSYRPETRQVQDWSEISKHADLVRIMAYDYTYSGDYFPGPIGPLSWIRQILDYASNEIPRDKTVLGVHLYAYEWSKAESAGELELQPDSAKNLHNNQASAKAYTYYNVENILKSYKGESSSLEGEKVFYYTAKNASTGQNERRVLVYIDKEGVDARMNLAKEYGINGVVFWRLGGQGGLNFEN